MARVDLFICCTSCMHVIIMADNKSKNVDTGTTEAPPIALDGENTTCISAVSAVPVGPSGAVVTASEHANGTNSCDPSGTTTSNSAGTAVTTVTAGSSRRRRTKKVAKRRHRDNYMDADADAEDVIMSPSTNPPAAEAPAAAAAAPPPADTQTPQSNITKLEWERQRDERRRQIVADIAERRNNLSGRSKTATPADAPTSADDGASSHKGSAIDNDGKDNWIDIAEKGKRPRRRLAGRGDGDYENENSASDGSFSGSPTCNSFVCRRRQMQMQQQQQQQQTRRSSSDFIMLDTTTTSEDDDDDDDGGEKEAGDSSSEYHDSEDGDLSSSDDNSDQNADGSIISTRRSTRSEGSTAIAYGARITKDGRAAPVRARAIGARADSSGTSRASMRMTRPSNGDAATNPFNASFTADDPGAHVGGGRRTKKMRSAKRLATVSMPRTGQALKGQAIMVAGSVASGEKSGESGSSESGGSAISGGKTIDHEVAGAKPAAGNKNSTQRAQVRQQPLPTTPLQDQPVGGERVVLNAAVGTNVAMPPSVPQSQPRQQQRRHQAQAQQYLPQQSWSQIDAKLPGHELTNASDNVAVAFNGTNADTTSGNGTPNRKRGRPKKNYDSSGININSSSIPKTNQPISPPLPDPPKPEGLFGQVQQPVAVPTSLVVPTGVEETVSKAASLVAAEIKSGCWVRRWADSLSIVDTTDHIDITRIEKLRDVALHTAAAALEQFAMEMILPSFISAGVKEGPGGGTDSDSSSGGSHRTLSGTFLALREILMMNADAYFFHVGRSDKDRPDPPLESPGNSTSYDAEEKVLRSRLIATGVLFASVNRLDEERENVLADLVAAIGEYDAAEDTFVLCLERADGRSLGVLPNGHALGQEENIAWGVSFNAAREKHPLITTKKRRDLARRLASYSSSVSDEHKTKLAHSILNDTMHRLGMPKPNACAFYFVGEDDMMIPDSISPR